MEHLIKILGVGLLLLVLYVFNNPIPKGFSKPMKLRLMLVVFTLGNVYIKLVVLLRIRSRIQQIRVSISEMDKRSPKLKTHQLVVTDTTFDGVKVKLFQPEKACVDTEGYPTVIFLHGGGWILGVNSFYNIMGARLARAANVIVVIVDYRLAPEHLFPAAFEDCLAVTKYFLSHARQFGADPHRVALSGDSAGGNLTAAVTLKLRDEGFSPKLKRQQLIYPALQALDFYLPSMIQNRNGPILRSEGLAYGWSMYISGSDKFIKDFMSNGHTSDDVKQKLAKTNLNHQLLDQRFFYKPYRKPDINKQHSKEATWTTLKDRLMNPYLCPLVANDFSGLPDAYVFTCQYDPLRDEGQLYAKHLSDAGAKVTLVNTESGFHGIMSFWNFKEGRDAFQDMIDDTITHLCKPEHNIQSSL